MNVTIREKDSGFQAIVSYKQNGKWKQKSKQGFKLRKDAKNDYRRCFEYLFRV